MEVERQQQSEQEIKAQNEEGGGGRCGEQRGRVSQYSLGEEELGCVSHLLLCNKSP